MSDVYLREIYEIALFVRWLHRILRMAHSILLEDNELLEKVRMWYILVQKNWQRREMMLLL